jgi:hypothetical protein
MNQARDRRTNESIEAEELKLIPQIDISDYECIDENCKIQLIPCSCKNRKQQGNLRSVRKEHPFDGIQPGILDEVLERWEFDEKRPFGFLHG